jgi:DeoR/GlpR family transcriptional regulator of sugar metabolism
VHAHHALFIDGGSTALALAQILASPDAPRPLTIITAAFDVAALFANDPTVQLVLAGGTWSHETREFFGDQAQATIRAHRADWAFLGACALHQRAGLTTSLAGDAQVKRAMIESAAHCAVLADATKHDMVAPYAVVDLREIDVVISDAEPSWLAGAVREVVRAV